MWSLDYPLTQSFQEQYGSGIDLACNRKLSVMGTTNAKVNFVKLTASPQSLCLVSRKCGCLYISQSYGPPWLVTWIALHLFYSFRILTKHYVFLRTLKLNWSRIDRNLLYVNFISQCFGTIHSRELSKNLWWNCLCRGAKRLRKFTHIKT
jgi:hypothetical protein